MITEELKSGFILELQAMMERVAASSGLSPEEAAQLITETFASPEEANDSSITDKLVSPSQAHAIAAKILSLDAEGSPDDLNTIAKIANALGSADALTLLQDALTEKLDSDTFTTFLSNLEDMLLGAASLAKAPSVFTTLPLSGLTSKFTKDWVGITPGKYSGVVDISLLGLTLEPSWDSAALTKYFLADITVTTDPVTGYPKAQYEVNVTGTLYTAATIAYPHSYLNELVWRTTAHVTSAVSDSDGLLDMLSAVNAVSRIASNEQPNIDMMGTFKSSVIVPSNTNLPFNWNILVGVNPVGGSFGIECGTGAGALDANFTPSKASTYLTNSGGGVKLQQPTFGGGDLSELEWKVSSLADSKVNVYGMVAGTWTPAKQFSLVTTPTYDRWHMGNTIVDTHEVSLELRNTTTGLSATHLLQLVTEQRRASPTAPNARGYELGIFDGRLSSASLSNQYSYNLNTWNIKYGREQVISNGEVQLHLDVVRNPDMHSPVLDGGNFMQPLRIGDTPDEYRITSGWALAFGLTGNRNGGLVKLDTKYDLTLDVEWIDNGLRRFKFMRSVGNQFLLHEIDANDNVSSVADTAIGTVLNNLHSSEAICGICSSMVYANESVFGLKYLFPTIPVQVDAWVHPDVPAIKYDVVQGQFLITLSATPKDSADGRTVVSRQIKIFSY